MTAMASEATFHGVGGPGATDRAHVHATTAEERAMPFPCDRYEGEPDDAYFRAIDIEAPGQNVFRWLCQLRAAPYSYDLIDNFGRRSPRRLTPGLDDLQLGQRFMTIFDLAEFERDVHITLVLRRGQRPLGGGAVTYGIAPRDSGSCRLIVKILVRHPGGSIESRLRGLLLPWGDLVMMRKQLLNLKELAEGQVSPGSAG
jgi:hypothetical protein